VHARLADLDVAELIRLAGDAGEARRGIGIGAVSVFGALAMGIAASTTLAAPAPARTTALAPFAASAPFAPSTLLEGGR
jgi:hypothetical protein